MKKLLVFSLCLSCTLQVIAQTYHPFPVDSARWRVSYGMSIAGCTGFAGEAQYEITGDTIIDNQTYHKIYQISYSSSPSCYMTGGNGFACGIREDSSKHVYRRYDALYPEELLYDFNLNVGDTVHTMQNCGCDAVVDSIDSVLVGATYRKQYHVALNFFCGGGHIEIIEGVGSTGGPMECFGWLEAGSSLTCFWQDGNTLLPTPNTNCAPLVEGVDGIENETVLSVNPNPAIDEVVITSSLQYLHAQEVTITDVNGRIVRREVIEPVSGGLLIARRELTPGMYFIEVRSNDSDPQRVKVIFW